MGKNKVDDEQKIVRRLRILFIKIPLIVWIVLLLIIFFIYPTSGIFFAAISAVVMIPWLLFWNRFIK